MIKITWILQISLPSHIIINYKHIDFISWHVSFPFSKTSHLKKLAILTIFSTSKHLPCQMHSKWSDLLPIQAWFYRRQSMSCVQLSTEEFKFCGNHGLRLNKFLYKFYMKIHLLLLNRYVVCRPLEYCDHADARLFSLRYVQCN